MIRKIQTSKIKRVQRGQRHRQGGLTIEMALCVPILMVLLFGCYEMAHANMLIHTTESAAYAGCRAGITPGTTPEKIRAEASQVLRSVGINNFTVTITPAVIENDTEEVTVDIAVPFKANTSIPTRFIEDPTFRGSCTLSREVL